MPRKLLAQQHIFCRRNRRFVISLRALRLIARFQKKKNKASEFQRLLVCSHFSTELIRKQDIQSLFFSLVKDKASHVEEHSRRFLLIFVDRVKWIRITLSPQMQSNPIECAIICCSSWWRKNLKIFNIADIKLVDFPSPISSLFVYWLSRRWRSTRGLADSRARTRCSRKQK